MFFLKKFQKTLSKSRGVVDTGERDKAPSLEPGQLHIQIFKTLVLMMSHYSRYAKRFIYEKSENSDYEYKIASYMAMTVKLIMILLYGAGGVPGRGEIPMI